MSEEAVAAPPAAMPAHRFSGVPQRLHPFTLLLSVLRLGPRSLNMIPAAVALGVTGQARFIIPAVAAYLLISLAFNWLAWARFSWTVDADDVTIASGVISRQQRVIPFDRIQDVSIEQGLLARLFGLAKVGFETGSAGADENEAKLDAIALADAEALREHIRTHRSGAVAPAMVAADPDTADAAAQAVPAAVPAVPDEGRIVFAMDGKRLIVAGLFNFSLAIFAVLLGLLSQVDDLLPFDPFDIDMYIDLSRSLGLGDWVIAHQWLSFVGGGIAVLLLGLATGIVRTVLRDYGFTLERTARGLRRRRGLTTRTDVTLPIARVQAATVATGFIRRAFGWFEVKLTSLAGDGKDEKDHGIAPLASLDEVDAILAELTLDRAGFEDSGHGGEGWHRSHPVGIYIWPLLLFGLGCIMLIPNMLSPEAFILADAIDPDLSFVLGAPLVVALPVLLFGWLDWRHRRWRFDGRLLHITDGFLSRSHIILPARNIQSVEIGIGPIVRRVGAAHVRLGVPGGSASIAAIPRSEAMALRAALLAAR